MGTLITLLVIFIIVVVLALIYAAINSLMPDDILLNWNHYFPDLQFSTLQFYDAVEKVLKEREIPHTDFYQVEFSETGTLTDRHRKYLRVRSGIHLFDICAAPYGKGFFVSWWLGLEVTLDKRILMSLPFIGGYIKRKLFKRTYYGWDTEDMFQEAVHLAVMETIDKITEQKGARALSELQRIPRSPRR